MACKTFTLPTGKTIDGMARAVSEFFLHKEYLNCEITPQQDGSYSIHACKKDTSFPSWFVSIAPEGEHAAKVVLVSSRMLHLYYSTLILYPVPFIHLLDIAGAAQTFLIERKLHAAIRAYLEAGENAA